MQIRETAHKNLPAVALENEALRAVFVPRGGGKLASLIWRATDSELLMQNDAPEFRLAAHGATFDLGECAGFDDMLPTIDPCVIQHAGRSVTLPDHGEVWTLPWTVESSDANSLTLAVECRRVPARLRKRLWLDGGCLHMDYTLQHTGKALLELLYAAHPLFTATPGMRITVPGQPRTIVNAAGRKRLGDRLTRHTFPLTKLEDGTTFDLGTVPPFNDYGFQKYYFAEPVREGWCLLTDVQRDLQIGMSWTPEVLPWLGMWVSEGGFMGHYCVAPEPASAPMDSPTAAADLGVASTMPAGATWNWRISIAVGAGTEAHAVDAAGQLVHG